MTEQFIDTIHHEPRDKYAEEVIQVLTTPLALRPEFLDPGPEAADYVKFGFAPRGSDLRDFSIIRHDGIYHLFYIDLRRDQHSRTPTQGTIIGHSSSSDLITWQVHEPAIMVKPDSCESAHVYAPYVVKWNNEFHMIYSGQNKKLAQTLCRASSKDLFDWRRYDCNPMFTPEHLPWARWKRTELSNCRDPHVFLHGDDLLLYYTALCRDGQVCVACAKSRDMENWEDLGPIYHFLPRIGASPLCLESSCVHQIGGKFVLFFSYDNATRYTESESPTDFRGRPHHPVWEGHWALEVVARKDNRLLVASFKKARLTGDARLFFGLLDWNKEPRIVERIPDTNKMKEIYESI
jgi:hypothetical protein